MLDYMQSFWSRSRQSEQQKRKRQPRGGRKRHITKSDDDKLVKRLKLGENRNERQMKLLDDINLGTCVLNDNGDDDYNNKKLLMTMFSVIQNDCIVALRLTKFRKS